MNGAIDKEDLKKAAEVIRKGGTILYPTETVWGLGCDATNSDAVKKIFSIKHRDDSKALISLVSDIDMLFRWVDDIPDAAIQLIEATDRPLTIIYDNPLGLAPELLAEDGSAAIRITSDPYAKALCHLVRKPIVSTSANISGCKPPLGFFDISDDIISQVDYSTTVRREEKSVNRPSSVIKVSVGNLIQIIRP